MTNTKLFNTLLQTLAPARTRRKRARASQNSVDISSVFTSSYESSARPLTATQLQAAYNARRADEARSSLC